MQRLEAYYGNYHIEEGKRALKAMYQEEKVWHSAVT
jgi:hypothetical protein